MSTKNNDFNFFLSYSHDIELSNIIEIIDDFEECGIKIWVDVEHIISGTKIAETFDDILMKTQHWYGAIILIDSTYFNKPWCIKELNYFLDNNIPIFPFSYEYNIENIIHNQAILDDYNIISLDKKTTSFSYSFVMLKHVISYLSCNVDCYFDKQILFQIDPILNELWLSFNQKEIYIKGRSIIKILKASPISYWINYKYCADINSPNCDNKLMDIFYFYISYLHKKAISENLGYDKLLNKCIYKILCYMIKEALFEK